MTPFSWSRSRHRVLLDSHEYERSYAGAGPRLANLTIELNSVTLNWAMNIKRGGEMCSRPHEQDWNPELLTTSSQAAKQHNLLKSVHRRQSRLHLRGLLSPFWASFLVRSLGDIETHTRRWGLQHLGRHGFMYSSSCQTQASVVLRAQNPRSTLQKPLEFLSFKHKDNDG